MKNDLCEKIIKNVCIEYFGVSEWKYSLLMSEIHDDRYIMLLELNGAYKYVVKAYSNGYNTNEKVFEIQQFVKFLKSNDIQTPEIINTINSNPCIVCEFDDTSFTVWVEEYLAYSTLGSQINNKKVDVNTIYEIGKLRGKMHQLAKENNMHLSWYFTTILYHDFMGVNDNLLENYKKLINVIGSYKSRNTMKIIELFNQRYELIKRRYSDLPKGSTQADFGSLDNILVNENKLIGVLDFNMAHEDVFLNEMIQEAVLFGLQNSSEIYSDERLKLTKSYIDGYLSVCELNEVEKSLFLPVFNIQFTFLNEIIEDVKKSFSQSNSSMYEKLLDYIVSSFEVDM